MHFVLLKIFKWYLAKIVISIKTKIHDIMSLTYSTIFQFFPFKKKLKNGRVCHEYFLNHVFSVQTLKFLQDIKVHP